MKTRKRKHRQRANTNELPATLETVSYTPHTEIQKTTLQVPRGAGSILDELRQGFRTPIQAITYLVYHYRSNWDSGKSWYSSTRKISKLLGISTRWLRFNLNSLLQDFLERKKIGKKGSLFQIVHNLPHALAATETDEDNGGGQALAEDACAHGSVVTTTDLPATSEDEDRLKLAVPRGTGGPFERLFAGDISWRACLIWIVLRHQSTWATGRVGPISMERLASLVRMHKGKVCDAVRELEAAGMLERLTKKWECSEFQMYPRPPQKQKRGELYRDAEFWYSANGLWRISIDSAEFERRVSKKHAWKRLSGKDFARMPKPIAAALEKAVRFSNQLAGALSGGSDTARGSAHTARGSAHTARGNFGSGGEPSPALT